MKKKKDRFNGYSAEVRELVLAFEEMLRKGERNYMDEDQLEVVIDYYLEINNVDMLSKSVRFAERLFPSNSEIRLRRSHLLCAQGRFDEALPILRDLERQEPSNTDVAYALGALYSAIDDHARSIRYYKQAATDGYELGTVYGNIGDEYVALDHLKEAVVYYKRALAISSKETRSMYNLVQTLEQMDQMKELVAYFDKYIHDHPYSKEAWLCLAYGHHNIQELDEAEDCCQYALAIDDTFFDAYQELSDVRRDQGRIEEAVSALHQSFDYAPLPQDIYHQIANLYMDYRDNFTTAIVYLKKALDLDNENAFAWYDLALCYLRQANPFVGESPIGWSIEVDETQSTADYQPALNAISKALQLNPQSPDFLVLASTIASLMGDFEQAETLCRYAVELEDYDVKYWASLASLLMFCLQQWDKAIDVMREGLTKCDDPMPLQPLLAICYYMTGRRNFLFNALSATVHNCPEMVSMMLEACPEMQFDYDVMNIINATE